MPTPRLQFGANDAAPYEIHVEASADAGGQAMASAESDGVELEAEEGAAGSADGALMASGPKLLVPLLKRLPARRVVTYHNVTGAAHQTK